MYHRYYIVLLLNSYNLLYVSLTSGSKIKLSIDLCHAKTFYIHDGHSVFNTDKQEDMMISKVY